ncbi:hypothetical protein IJ182_02545 [bacterium]|nr:hypothetical protein [bacterium]
MVYEKIKNLIVILFISAILILSVFSFNIKTNFETNLAKAILPNNITSSSDMLDVTNKYSSVIKVVFEDKEGNSEKLKSKFQNNINKDFFEPINNDFKKLINEYLKHPTNFLSDKTLGLLKNEEYEIVKQNALEAIYNPAGIPLTELDKDPYLLFMDYLTSLNNTNMSDDENIYDYCILKIKNGNGLSPDLINTQIKELIKVQKSLTTDSQKIYLAGTPIHSYYTSEKASVSINIICFLTTILIIFLTFLYFKSIKVLIPVMFSIITGFWTGFIITKMCFGTFHLITLVFATTLIGIGIDYSYHYLFSEKKDKTLFKNLTYSMLTTVAAFVLLYFTNIELLQQISIFTVSGLITIYLFVICIYPCIKFPKPIKQINLKIGKAGFWIICCLLILSCTGFIKLSFDDSLSAFYTPSKKLLNAEMLFNKVAGQENRNMQIITIKGENLQTILEREEELTETDNIKYYSISKFIPSIKKQNESIKYVEKLYKNNLNSFNNILSKQQIEKLMHQESNSVEIDINEYPYLKDFMLNENTSIMFIYSEIQDIKDKINAEYTEIINFNNDVTSYLNKYRIKLLKMIPLVFITVFIMLCFIFKPIKAVKMIIPQLSACIFSIGILSLTGQDLNLFSIISLFLIIGFTIDYSIFRADRNSETAVFVSCLTTSFSFLALSFTGFKLISSISIILFIGIITSYIVGLYLLSQNTKE